MGDLSKHFNRDEFNCTCGCGFDTVDYALIEALEVVRNHYNKPVIITGGNRCEQRNKEILGAKNSQHIKGKASDFMVQDVEAKEVYKYLDKLYNDKYGLGLYSNRCHLDVRDSKARWDKSV